MEKQWSYVVTWIEALPVRRTTKKSYETTAARRDLGAPSQPQCRPSRIRKRNRGKAPRKVTFEPSSSAKMGRMRGKQLSTGGHSSRLDGVGGGRPM